MAINIKKEYGNSRSRKPDISTLVYGKIPPQAPELEEAVLGAILLERDKLDEVIALIYSSEVFYVDANRKIFDAVLSLYQKQKVVDLLTVTEELRKSDNLEIIGNGFQVIESIAVCCFHVVRVRVFLLIVVGSYKSINSR